MISNKFMLNLVRICRGIGFSTLTERGSALKIESVSKHLKRLENVEVFSEEIEELHSLVKRNGFIYDDRVQRSLERLRSCKGEIEDYETLLKSAEIFYGANEVESMKELMNHFAKDIPYIPNHILVQLTKYYTKKVGESEVTKQLRSQLYLNTITRIEEEKKEKKVINEEEDTKETNLGDIESLLYCSDGIKDEEILKEALTKVSFEADLGYPDLVNLLKLYEVLAKRKEKIEGYMENLVDKFQKKLKEDVLEKSGNLEVGGVLDHNRNLVNCYRLLIRIRNYEDFGLPRVSDEMNGRNCYSFKDLTLIMREFYNSTYHLEERMYRPILDQVLENITQLSKDELIMMLKFLKKRKIELKEEENELVNLQVEMYLMSYNLSDLSTLLDYYTDKGKENVRVVQKLYNNWDINNNNNNNNNINNNNNSNNFTLFISKRVDNIDNDNAIPNNNNNNKINSYNYNNIGINNKVDWTRVGDMNKNIYVLSKFIGYFRDKEALNGMMVKRYVRKVEDNYINLSNKVVSYTLYTLYKVGYNPVKMVKKLMPILYENLSKYNGVDLCQILLFFTRFKDEHFERALIEEIKERMGRREFNEEQVSIICKCMCNYKKSFTSNMFSVVEMKLERMNASQVCTVINAYAKSGLNNSTFIAKINEYISKNKEKLKKEDVFKLLLPIKRGYIRDLEVVDWVRRSGMLSPSDHFDVFGEIPDEDLLSDSEALKCILRLGSKERSLENDRFARRLFNQVVKMGPKLTSEEAGGLLNSLHSYGYIKPKISRILTNKIQKSNMKKESKKKEEKEDQSKKLFKFFRHISKGPPHLDKVNKNKELEVNQV